MTYVNDLLLSAMTGLKGLTRRLREESGQDLIEYALLGGMIALAIIGVSALFLTGALTGMVTGIGNCVDFDALTGCDPF